MPSGACLHCPEAPLETTEHIFWGCPAWSAVRARFPDLSPAVAATWPPCLRLCGIIPLATLPTPAARQALATSVQAMLAHILLARNERQPLPTPGSSAHPLQPPAPRPASTPSAPWLWAPTGPAVTYAHPSPFLSYQGPGSTLTPTSAPSQATSAGSAGPPPPRTPVPPPSPSWSWPWTSSSPRASSSPPSAAILSRTLTAAPPSHPHSTSGSAPLPPCGGRSGASLPPAPSLGLQPAAPRHAPSVSWASPWSAAWTLAPPWSTPRAWTLSFGPSPPLPLGASLRPPGGATPRGPTHSPGPRGPSQAQPRLPSPLSPAPRPLAVGSIHSTLFPRPPGALLQPPGPKWRFFALSTQPPSALSARAARSPSASACPSAASGITGTPLLAPCLCTARRGLLPRTTAFRPRLLPGPISRLLPRPPPQSLHL